MRRCAGPLLLVLLQAQAFRVARKPASARAALSMVASAGSDDGLTRRERFWRDVEVGFGFWGLGNIFRESISVLRPSLEAPDPHLHP